MKNYGKILISTAVLLAAMVAIYVCSMAAMARADTVSTGWRFLPFTTTATAPKTGWYNIQTGYMYDKANNVLSASPTWTNCVTAISVDATTGIFEEEPELTMPAGEYIWRLYDVASPAYTDEPVKSKHVVWNGKKITLVSDI